MKLILALTLLALPFGAFAANKTKKAENRVPSSEGMLCGSVVQVGFDEANYIRVKNRAGGHLVFIQLQGSEKSVLAARELATNALTAGSHSYFCMSLDGQKADAIDLNLGDNFSITHERYMER